MATIFYARHHGIVMLVLALHHADADKSNVMRNQNNGANKFNALIRQTDCLSNVCLRCKITFLERNVHISLPLTVLMLLKGLRKFVLKLKEISCTY